MTKSNKAGPRITIECEDAELVFRLRNAIQHGLQRQIFEAIVSDLVDILEGPYGDIFQGAIISRDKSFRLGNWIKVPKLPFNKLIGKDRYETLESDQDVINRTIKSTSIAKPSPGTFSK